jgi:serine/threonine protein kinase
MKRVADKVVNRLREAAAAPDLSGTRYRLLGQIARGGMGAVYLAEDAQLSRRVGLKVLPVPDAQGDLVARLLREARTLARLEHPGIVPVHDVGTLADGRVFYTMKFVEGSRLDHYLEQPRSLPDRLRVFQRICEAVAFAHARGVLHRDLKPENIMVGPFGEVLVMDWGLAKILRDPAGEAREDQMKGSVTEPRRKENLFPGLERPAEETPTGPDPVPGVETAHGVVLGAPGYMASEQARGEVHRLDERTDVFALGAILRVLLTGAVGKVPAAMGATMAAGRREAEAPKWQRSVPPDLAAICVKAMTHDPGDRYDSAQELAADVARYLDGLPVLAYPENLFRKVRRLYLRHQTAVILVLAYLFIRILLIALQGR